MPAHPISDRFGHGPVVLATEEVQGAGDSARRLRVAIDSGLPGPSSVCLLMGDSIEEQIVLPREAALLLADMLDELANGSAVTLVSLEPELTTQEAANLLSVSRPYLVHLLEQGEIAYRKVGNRRRVPFADLMRYKDQQCARSRLAVAELTRQAEELGLGYDD